MGIKHFFSWYKQKFSENIYNIYKGDTIEKYDKEVDNFMIDMNGIFHNSSQKVYKYGNFKVKRLIKVNPDNIYINHKKKQTEIFEDVCRAIESQLEIIKPKKRLILCVDGPAPISKQNQQRQRRFRSAFEAPEEQLFDSNCITPGTKFMDFLTKYIDWYIKLKLETSTKWKDLEVIFSNEKSPGEGEHKIINYIRKYGEMNETFCISGMDADLIMLSLVTHMPKLYILREDMYVTNLDYYLINIGNTRNELVKLLKWTSPKYKFNNVSCIDDFVFLCFATGNDFLPHIPSIEIIENGIELMLDVYKQTCSTNGHITYRNKRGVFFNNDSFALFMDIIGSYEKTNLENKLENRKNFYKDELLEKNSTQKEDKWEVDIDAYLEDYCKESFGEDYDIDKISTMYIEGTQWVMSYYTCGVSNWKWLYEYHYAPPASMLVKSIKKFVNPIYPITTPSTTFQQLLCVLPPKSSELLPYPYNTILKDENSPLKEFCPDSIKIDLSGKRQSWEGIVLLPMVDFKKVSDVYSKNFDKLSEIDKKRNIMGRTFKYIISPHSEYLFKSYYGNIENCKVRVVLFDL